jgi:hypothetical protein
MKNFKISRIYDTEKATRKPYKILNAASNDRRLKYTIGIGLKRLRSKQLRHQFAQDCYFVLTCPPELVLIRWPRTEHPILSALLNLFCPAMSACSDAKFIPTLNNLERGKAGCCPIIRPTHGIRKSRTVPSAI